jgi:hypothetical protein
MALGSRDWSSKKSSFYIVTQVIWRVSLDSISIKQQQMGDVSHQQTCVMCFLAIICFDFNTELECCVDRCVTTHRDAKFQDLSNEAPE